MNTNTNTPSAENLQSFASEVLAAAKVSRGARPFGQGKVFISRAWNSFRDRTAAHRDMDSTTFKRWLVLANKAALVELSRADLVEALDPKDVAKSETCDLSSRYHFIRLF